MRLADDDRGRVPFAVIGILLLVGSATLSATISTRPAPHDGLAVDRAVEQATATSQSVLTASVKRTGHEAAREPVLEPANTTYGRVLNASTPFRDYLRIRIYLAAREDLEAVDGRSGAVHAHVSLPKPTNASDLRRAKRRVHIRKVDAGSDFPTRLRVRIDGVKITVRRNGRVIDEETRSATVVVSTPVLALHERVTAYEERLNRGPLDSGVGAGLGARLTARLYPMAWARGYAQYGGTPIENVVANRHVAFATNGGVLGVQQAVFGGSDPAGRAAISRAGKRVAVQDLLAGIDLPGERWVDVLLRADSTANTDGPNRPAETDSTAADGLVVGVNRTADTAFREFIAGRQSPTLETVIDSVYRADVRLEVDSRRTVSEPRPEARAPGNGWELVNESTDTSIRVEPASGPTPSRPSGWETLETYSRRVVKTHTTVRHWRRGNRTRRLVSTWKEADIVGIGLFGEAGPTEYAPDRGIATVYERGGPLDGPNLRGVPSRAERRLIANQGGVDAIARRAVSGTVGIRTATVRGQHPPALRNWLYADLADMRERVRNVSVEVERGAVGTHRTNPPAELASALRERRAALIEAPATYGSVADKARIAARTAYLDRVLARLDSRAARSRETRSGLNDALETAGVDSLERIDRIAQGRTNVREGARRQLQTGGPSGTVSVAVDGEPSYLTLDAVENRHTSAVESGETFTPLAARNLNVFTVPYGDAADAVVAEVAGDGSGRRVDLRTAARSLRSANRTIERTENETLVRRRAVLQRQLERSMDALKWEIREDLSNEKFGLTAAERRAAVADGFARWDTTAARALAAANGSAAPAIAAEIEERHAIRSGRQGDWLRVRLRLSLSDARSATAVRVPQESVNRSASVTRRVSRRVAKKALESGFENASERASRKWLGETLGATPAGLPVAPVPGYWYATMNVWDVTVRGSYAEFTVRARYGTPETPGATMAYTRTEGTVKLDVNGDGTAERIGRTQPVSFETGTVVVVVVPPSGPGVGDRDGNADERSSGWSNAK